LIVCFDVNVRARLNNHIAVLIISRDFALRCVVDIFILDVENTQVDIDMIFFGKSLVDCIVEILNCLSHCRITQVGSRNMLHRRSRNYPS
jgi:hypothetical protein